MNHSPELEKSVLGQLIGFKDLYFNVSDMLNEDCFYDELHKVVYKAIVRVAKTTKIDVITIT